jgi:hypothetical protein
MLVEVLLENLESNCIVEYLEKNFVPKEDNAKTNLPDNFDVLKRLAHGALTAEEAEYLHKEVLSAGTVPALFGEAEPDDRPESTGAHWR